MIRATIGLVWLVVLLVSSTAEARKRTRKLTAPDRGSVGQNLPVFGRSPRKKGGVSLRPTVATKTFWSDWSTEAISSLTDARILDGTDRSRTFVHTLKNPLVLKTSVQESSAITSRGVELYGSRQIDFPHRIDLSSEVAFLPERLYWKHEPSRHALSFGDKQYIELTNSSALITRNAKGKLRDFRLVRAVRPYSTVVDLSVGSISTHDYYGDVLLVERVKTASGKVKFIPLDVVVRTDEKRGYIAEDPRIFTTMEKGRRCVYLGYTEVAAHNKVTGGEPDVMNRVIPLHVDRRTGVPRAPRTKPTASQKNALYLGPRPQVKNGKVVLATAKNGMFHQNALGQYVVRMRLLLDFNNPYIKRLARGRRWKYAEQIFVFRSKADLMAYNWDEHTLLDLFADGPASRTLPKRRVKPLMAKVLITDNELQENYTDKAVIEKLGKGFGPGTMPVRVRRQGDKIYVSEGYGAEEILGAHVPKGMRDSYALRDGEEKFIAWDHEMRYFADRGLRKRHCSGAIKLLDSTMTRIDAYYADAIQPREWYQRGAFSGIMDLQHVYPVGRTIHANEDGKGAMVRVIAGASDAHTARYEFDLHKLMIELSPGSKRWESGQIYRPQTPRGWATSHIDLN